MKRSLLALAALALLAFGSIALSSEQVSEKDCPPVSRPSDCCYNVCPQ